MGRGSGGGSEGVQVRGCSKEMVVSGCGPARRTSSMSCNLTTYYLLLTAYDYSLPSR